MARTTGQFVSRAGQKLDAALENFGIDVAGLTCADFGCNVGGFTDCLLQRGAAAVVAVDTGYGDFAWTLRHDPRVQLHERTNLLHVEPLARVDLVVLDMGWTPLERSVPIARDWLGEGGQIVALLKPHFEAAKQAGRRPFKPLGQARCDEVAAVAQQQLHRLGVQIRAGCRAPIKGKGGNREYLLWLEDSRVTGCPTDRAAREPGR